MSNLPINIEGYDEKRISNKLQECKCNISMFMMKDMFSQVSHISHQNKLSDYVRTRLSIQELVDEMQEGLLAVDGMLQCVVAKRDEIVRQKKKRILSISIIVGALFTVLQTYANSIGIYESYYSHKKTFLQWFFGGSAVLVSAIVIGVIAWGIYLFVTRYKGDK
jgi:heme/copper-type cytochrome/quinol oxidase subunit 3